jgi:hypothetical protein
MKLSENITAIFAMEEGGSAVTIKTILDRVSVKSFGILLVIFSIPSAMPVPAPGYSIPGGIALLMLGMQIFKKRDYPWLPQRVLDKKVHVGNKPKLLNAMVFFLRIFEFFIRPRLGFMFKTTLTLRFFALIIILCGLSMCIPVPLTNTAPAFGVFLIGLGMLEEDGFLSSVGVLAGLIGLTLSVTVLCAIVYFGWEGVDIVKEFIKSLLH